MKCWIQSMSSKSKVVVLLVVTCSFVCVSSQSSSQVPDVSFNYPYFDTIFTNKLLVSGNVSNNAEQDAMSYVGGRYIALASGWEAANGTLVSSGRILHNLGISMMNKSFSTQFTFFIDRPSESHEIGEDGIAFLMVANPTARIGSTRGCFGIFDANGTASDVTFAVEFDTFQNSEFQDIAGNHVGVDKSNIRSAKSVNVSPLCLNCGSATTAWIDYSNWNQRLDVRLATTWPVNVSPAKPEAVVLTYDLDLSKVVNQFMWVGFSASTSNTGNAQNHYLYRWTFQTFNESSPPGVMGESRMIYTRLAIGLSLGLGAICFISILIGCWRWGLKCRSHDSANCEVDIVVDAPHRFKYKQLSAATDNFSEKLKLGDGGFGSVFRGHIPSMEVEIAVKKVRHDSKQGLKEFIAEISIISRLRHRNLVQLLGWCREGAKLLLVYDYMPRGSLDKILFTNDGGEDLSWPRRFKIVKGVAAALYYLHEGWQQQVIHRDVKPSNVMLDKDYNAKLGDFGLARLMEHQNIPQTTRIAGTWGYIAPELVYTGKATDKTDVYSFGALILEIASGKPAVDRSLPPSEVLLVDRIWHLLTRGEVLSAADDRLQGKYDSLEMHTVLVMGLLCSHPEADHRPTMRQLVQVFSGEVPIPPVPISKPVPIFTCPSPMQKFGMETSHFDSSVTSMFGSSTTICSPNKAPLILR